MLRSWLARFVRAEEGAVTVDWVALTGALVGLGILIVLRVAQDATGAATGVGMQIEATEIPGTTFSLGTSGQGAGTGDSTGGTPAGSLNH